MPRTQRSAALVALATLTLVIASAACSSPATSPGATRAVVDGGFTITAADLQFDVGTIEATAGEPFTVTLVNNDSEPHNFSVYSEEGGETIVIGTIIGEGETVEVTVPALEVGTYFFRCDVHPEMKGSIVVTAAQTGGGLGRG